MSRTAHLVLAAALCPLLACAGASCGCGEGRAGPSREAAPQPITSRSSARVFFVGHSLINHEMPRNFEVIAESLGLEVEWDAQIIDGAPLEVQVEQPERGRPARFDEALPSGRFDTVVMTEAVPIDDMIRYRAPARHAARLAREARRANPRARLFLYESWMRRDLTRGLPFMKRSDWRAFLAEDLPKWEEVAAEAATRSGVEIAVLPAGRSLGALADAVSRGEVPGLSEIDELFVDPVHLAPAGNHFVAAVTLAAVFGTSPAGASGEVVDRRGRHVATLPERTREALYAVAWASVASYARARPPHSDDPARALAEGSRP